MGVELGKENRTAGGVFGQSGQKCGGISQRGEGEALQRDGRDDFSGVGSECGS